MPIPPNPKIYHIVHVDRLRSIIKHGCLWCDAKIAEGGYDGTAIGMEHIKRRRLQLPLLSRPGLHVGECVPFNFCPRSVMLFVIFKGEQAGLPHRSGQKPIIHLEADLHATVTWANQHQLRWAFTLSNAGSRHFQDRNNLAQVSEINWVAVCTDHWSGKDILPSVKEEKQAEFLVERQFPWELIERIGVCSLEAYNKVCAAIEAAGHKPQVEKLPKWYY